MLRPSTQVLYTCTRCLQALQRRHVSTIVSTPQGQTFTHSPLPRSQAPAQSLDEADHSTRESKQPGRDVSSSTSLPDGGGELGAMSRRLADATEESLLEGGRAGRKALDEAGFSAELKAKLLERVQAKTIQSDQAAAFAEAALPTSAGRGTREIAAAQAWSGTESTEDTVLRMLSDAHKPLKSSLRGSAKMSPSVDLRIKREPKRTSGQRLANARDKTSMYAISKNTQMSEKEREALKQELKDRFTPGARAMPHSFRGLAALANERIEDAIARGQFKNIPRGKAIERDARADNPFIDTTEYIMNKMIQRQEIVPPWIEKQQELVRAVDVFRGRLRTDWKRHAARTISSRGGTLQEQIGSAEKYAESERVNNPRKRMVGQFPTTMSDHPIMIKITQEAPSTEGKDSAGPAVHVIIETTETEAPTADESAASTDGLTAQSPPQPLPAPLRDAAWEKAEMSYLTLAIQNLNTLARSYNLMAPDLAKKPYFSLERELLACYADVAPQVGQAIIERAIRPARVSEQKVGYRSGGVLERLGGEVAKVHDSRKPLYGFREFWNDLWGEKERGDGVRV